jgi:hypothetical protein
MVKDDLLFIGFHDRGCIELAGYQACPITLYFLLSILGLINFFKLSRLLFVKWENDN